MKDAHKKSNKCATIIRVSLIPGVFLLIDALFDSLNLQEKLSEALPLISKALFVLLLEWLLDKYKKSQIKTLSKQKKEEIKEEIEAKNQQLLELDALLERRKGTIAKPHYTKILNARSKLTAEIALLTANQ